MTSQLALPFSDDSESRDQVRRLLDDTLFVEAGAGTGKTSALVDRYVALVLAGRRVDELVAITFTEKAAAELRDRVRGELEKRLATQDYNESIRIALDNLDRAQISTIHSFALTALRSFAAETGINPTFAIQDEVAAERRFEDAWRGYLNDLEPDEAALRAINRVLELGLWTRDLERLAHELWNNTAIAEMLRDAPLDAPAAPFPDLTDLSRQLASLHFDRVPAGDLLLPSIREIAHVIEELASAPAEDRDTVLATIVPPLRVSSNGRGTNWANTGVSIDVARQTARDVLSALLQALKDLRSRALADVLPLIVRFVTEESARRLRDGDLVFDDLILRLRNVLHTQPGARRRLRSRYRTLMIDEYQDTDPLQTDIALAFGTDPDSGVLEPGRLLLVGDPKQSIYRFRRADMTIYSRTRQALEQAGSLTPQLTLNRRSRDVVLHFVNTVFTPVIGNGVDPAVQPAYRPVHPHRGEKMHGPDVAYIGGELDMPAKQARRIETQQLAAYCREALTQGWEVQDRTTGELRIAQYRDIAVLVPARTILQPLERALGAAGVPYRVEGGSLVYATQEVRDLINCLTAIDDPSDEIAVVGALRSAAYSCSDVDLAQYRIAGGSLNYLAPSIEAASGPVDAALLDLRAMREKRHEGGLAGLVERFVASHPLVESSLYDTANRNAFRRARFVIEQARAFEAEAPASLRSFIAWLERRAGDAILDHEGAALDDDEDAVRVLTIHGAKGLEFPIVFLAGLGIGGRDNQASVLGLNRDTEKVAVAIGSKSRNAQFTLGPVDAINAQESLHRAAELDRLLYVATTRARDHLVLSLYRKTGTRECPAQRLVDHGATRAAVALPDLAPVTDAEPPPFTGLEIDIDPHSDEEFAAARVALVAGARKRLVTSATGLARLRKGLPQEAPSPEDEDAEREDETEPWARGRAGTHRGRAVHAALQVLPWDADDRTIEALASAQAVAETIPDEAGAIAGLLRAALRTDAASRARAALRSLREVPFAFVDGNVTLEGFIDLVIEAPEGLEIIDWKTDALPESDVDKRLESYRLQAGLYVLGLEAATGRAVTRVTYVFVTPGVERSPGEPAALAEAARAEIAQLTAAPA